MLPINNNHKFNTLNKSLHKLSWGQRLQYTSGICGKNSVPWTYACKAHYLHKMNFCKTHTLDAQQNRCALPQSHPLQSHQSSYVELTVTLNKAFVHKWTPSKHIQTISINNHEYENCKCNLECKLHDPSSTMFDYRTTMNNKKICEHSYDSNKATQHVCRCKNMHTRLWTC